MVVRSLYVKGLGLLGMIRGGQMYCQSRHAEEGGGEGEGELHTHGAPVHLGWGPLGGRAA